MTEFSVDARGYGLEFALSFIAKQESYLLNHWPTLLKTVRTWLDTLFLLRTLRIRWGILGICPDFGSISAGLEGLDS